jgi:catechol 2,3-dioxygenase-like lactoylglutathione lyase family enzyme
MEFYICRVAGASEIGCNHMRPCHTLADKCPNPSATSLVVRDYDEAIAWFTSKLQFTLIEDTKLSEAKRWVLVAPPGGENQCLLLLAKAASPEQESRIGDQTGGRVFLFLHTDDFQRDYETGQRAQSDPPAAIA